MADEITTEAQEILDSLEEISMGKGVRSFVMSGTEIIKARFVDFPNLFHTDISFKGDKRFGKVVDFATQVGIAIKEKDTQKFPKEIDEDTRKALLDSDGEVREKLMAEIFQGKIVEEFGQYDDPLIEAAKMMQEFEMRVAREVLDIEEGENFTAEDYEKVHAIFSDPNNEELIAIYEKHGDEYGEILQKMAHVNSRFDTDLDNIEETATFGKDSSNPETGPICRHTAPILAAMLSASGHEAYAFTSHGHMSVYTALGNWAEATVADSKDTYSLVLRGSLEEMKSPGSSLLLLSPNGKLTQALNPGGKRIATLAEVDDLSNVGEFVKSKGATEFYQQELEKEGPVDPSILPRIKDNAGELLDR